MCQETMIQLFSNVSMKESFFLEMMSEIEFMEQISQIKKVR